MYFAAWLCHLGEITLVTAADTPLSPTLHYKELQTFSLQVWQRDWARRVAWLRLMGPLVVRGCWEWAFRPHLLFIVNFLPRNHPKMQTDCRKIKQKINWPQVTRMRVFAVPSWSALVFSLIYWACIAEPAAWAQTHASHNQKQREGRTERESKREKSGEI